MESEHGRLLAATIRHRWKATASASMTSSPAGTAQEAARRHASGGDGSARHRARADGESRLLMLDEQSLDCAAAVRMIRDDRDDQPAGRDGAAGRAERAPRSGWPTMAMCWKPRDRVEGPADELLHDQRCGTPTWAKREPTGYGPAGRRHRRPHSKSFPQNEGRTCHPLPPRSSGEGVGMGPSWSMVFTLRYEAIPTARDGGMSGKRSGICGGAGTGMMATLGAFVREVSPGSEFTIALGRFGIGLIGLLVLRRASEAAARAASADHARAGRLRDFPAAVRGGVLQGGGERHDGQRRLPSTSAR